MGVVKQALQTDRLFLHQQTAFHVVDHLSDGDRLFIDVEDGPLAKTDQNVLKDANQIDSVGSNLTILIESGSTGFPYVTTEVLQAGVRPRSLFDLLLLQKHLRGSFEALVLEQTLHQFAAWVFGIATENVGRIARKQGFRLDVDQQRSHINELAGCVDVNLLEVLGVLEKLAGDARDGNVVDVDVLLADQVEQKIERAVVDLTYRDGERRLRCFFFVFVL